jgi:hypothetical protein
VIEPPVGQRLGRADQCDGERGPGELRRGLHRLGHADLTSAPPETLPGFSTNADGSEQIGALAEYFAGHPTILCRKRRKKISHVTKRRFHGDGGFGHTGHYAKREDEHSPGQRDFSEAVGDPAPISGLR